MNALTQKRSSVLNRLDMLIENGLGGVYTEILTNPLVQGAGLSPQYAMVEHFFRVLRKSIEFAASEFGSEAIPEELIVCNTINHAPLAFGYRQATQNFPDNMHTTYLFIAEQGRRFANQHEFFADQGLPPDTLVTAEDLLVLHTVFLCHYRHAAKTIPYPEDLANYIQSTEKQVYQTTCRRYGILTYPAGKWLMPPANSFVH